MARIAVVVEHKGREALLAALRETRHDVVVLLFSPEVPMDVRNHSPDMVIYDCDAVHSIEEDAFARLRASVDVPILVLGPRCDEAFVVSALKLGADACLCRSHGKKELWARIDAVLRRYWEWGEERHDELGDDPIIDRVSRSVIVAGRKIKLTSSECRLLDSLVERPGHVISREDLCERIWGDEGKDMPRVNLNLCVHNLRRKLERDPRHPELVMTKWGIGYYWRRGVRKA